MERHLGWPSYLAILIGLTVLVDQLFDFLGLGEASAAWVVGFVLLTILVDLFTGQAPAQEREEP